jgi:hypothetical protein
MMLKFPSIEQFRNTIRTVTDRARYAGRDEAGEPVFNPLAALPTIRFTGTVKLHGTNAGIEYDTTSGKLRFYSRERIISPGDDNAGFAQYMSVYAQELTDGFNQELQITENPHDVARIIIYGEWCGGNIQKGVAISGLPKMFVVFAQRIVYLDGTEKWTDTGCMELMFIGIPNFYEIHQFGYLEVNIDFSNPALIQNTLIELTEKVEAECPVGKHFGVSGIGEGIVWTSNEDQNLRFKVKGKKHSVSKVKTLAAVDVEAITAMNDFLDYAVTETRLRQGLDKLGEMGLPFEMKSMGEFIRWVYNDVVREEADTIEASGFDAKKLGGPIANRSRPWFITTYNNQA